MPQILANYMDIILKAIFSLVVSSLIKSYRAKSHKVVPVKSLHIIISRQVDREKGNASW